jgi:hypothetical protein
MAEGQDDSAHQRRELPEEAESGGVGAGGEKRQAGAAHAPRGRRRGCWGGGAPEGQGPAEQGVVRSGEPHGDGDGGVRHRGPGAARPRAAPMDGRGQRAVRRRRHLLAAGAAQGHRQHQAADHGTEY